MFEDLLRDQLSLDELDDFEQFTKAMFVKTGNDSWVYIGNLISLARFVKNSKIAKYTTKNIHLHVNEPKTVKFQHDPNAMQSFLTD